MTWHRTLLVLLLALSPVALARQDEARSTESVPVAPLTGITREQAQARIAVLEAATGGDEAERQALIASYGQLVQQIDAERVNAERAEAFRRAIESAPLETAQVRDELNRRRAEPPEAAQRPENETADSLQQRLRTVQAELTRLDGQVEELGRRLVEEEARSAQIQSQLASSRSSLIQIETEIASRPEPGPDAAEAERVARALLLARQRNHTTEIAMLREEQLSNVPRIELLHAQRDLAVWSADQAKARANKVEAWLSESRQAEADRARQQAERQRREAIGKHPLITKMAEEIAELSRETAQIIPRIDRARLREKDVEALLRQTEADLDDTTRSLDVGLTRAVGTMLLEQRRNLSDARIFRRAVVERSEEVATARLQLFRVQRQIKDLADPDAAVAVLLAGHAGAMSERDGDDVRAELVRLAVSKVEHLRRLEGGLRDYLSAVRVLEADEVALIAVADELAAILDERLIWFPNARAIDGDMLLQLHVELPKLVSLGLWRPVLTALREDVRSIATAYVALTLILGGLLLVRRRLRAQLGVIAPKVGRVRVDGIMLSVHALAIQLAAALPIPAAFVLLGWRLTVSPHSNDSSKAVGAGLMVAFAVRYALSLLRNLHRPDGLVMAHLRWSERTARLVRRHLLWFQSIAAPTAFVIALTQLQSDPAARHGPGRLAFIILMVATGVLAFILVHPTRGLFVGRAVQDASVWLRRTRRLWLPIGILVPFTLVVLAATGYYYAALQLEYRLNQTILIILFAVFLHAFCLRWLIISQRRLGMRVALERRAAKAKKSEAEEAEESAAVEGVIEALEEIDVAGIGDQTRDLLRVSVGLYLVVAIWFAWLEVLPALGVFDNVTLWHHHVLRDGEPHQVPITLANLGLAFLAIAVTITAARNMPGFLEIAVLQRLPLEPGVRYATRTLVLYAIVTTGVLLAFNAIGVGWSSVQWLVAALTVGLGFGLQEIFANFVSGLIILLERPMRVGDTVTVGGTSGVVTRIRMRATTITDWNRRELVVPNKSFITGELINWSLSDPIMRLDFVVGIAYGSNTTLAHQTMLRACIDHPLVIEQPEPNVFFTGFGDNSLNFDVRVFVTEQTNTGRTRILHDLHMTIDQACRENGITIAFPQRDLHLKTSETVLRVALEPAPGPLPGQRPGSESAPGPSA